MRHLAMLYAAESDAMQPGTAAWDEEMQGFAAFDEHAGDAIVAGEALAPSAEAITVRSGDGGVLVTQGPFAETTEVAGGLFVLDADTLDHAVDLARRIPVASRGSVELRPIVEWFGPDPDRSVAPGSRYLALIVGPATDADISGTAAWDDGAAAHGKWVAEAGDAIVAGAAVHPASTATTVRVRGDDVLVTDGPVAETGEIVGGFYILTATDRDAAARLAAGMPVNPGGAVELWPILDLE